MRSRSGLSSRMLETPSRQPSRSPSSSPWPWTYSDLRSPRNLEVMSESVRLSHRNDPRSPRNLEVMSESVRLSDRKSVHYNGKAPGRHGRKRVTCRFKQPINEEMRNILSAGVRHFTLPGKGFIDLSSDDQQVCTAFKDSSSQEEYRQSYLNVYLRTTKTLATFVHGLLVTKDMLEFDHARRTVLSFKQVGVSVGVKLRYDITCPNPDDLEETGVKNSKVKDSKVKDSKVKDSRVKDARVKEYDAQESRSSCCDDDVIDSLPDILTKMKDVGVTVLMWSVKFHLCFLQTRAEVKNSCVDLAHFALNCQHQGFVPILSLELTQNPNLSMEDAGHVLKDILATLVKTLSEFYVYKEGLILAVNPLCLGARKLKVMDVNGQPIYHTEQCADDDVFTIIPVEVTRAQVTAQALHQTLPASMGIVMTNYPSTPLSEINKVLNAINQCPVPRFTFHVGFCYTQVVQDGFLNTWGGLEKNWDLACHKLVTKAQMCTDATMGSHYPTTAPSIFISSEAPLDVPNSRWRKPIENARHWSLTVTGSKSPKTSVFRHKNSIDYL